MKIDRDEVRRIARLAQLEIDESSVERLAADMTKILDYVDQLRAFPVSSSGGSFAVSAAQSDGLREDEPQPGVAREDVQRNAPDWRDGFFVVPPVIE